MPQERIEDYLARLSINLATLLKQAIAEEIEILGRACTWNFLGGDRQADDGNHRVIPVADLLYLQGARDDRETGGIALTRHAFERQGGGLPGGINYIRSWRADGQPVLSQERVHGWTDLVVRAKAVPLRVAGKQKRKAGRKEIDDAAEITAARELVAAGKTDYRAAQEVAWVRYPNPKKDDDLRKRLARRVYEKLRKPD